MSDRRLTPARVGALLLGLLVYGLGVGFAAGGGTCRRCGGPVLST